MGFKKELVKKALHQYSKGDKSLQIKKFKRFAIVAFVVGFIGMLITIALVVLVVRWAWNSSNTAVQQNPTISSVVESTKEQVTSLLPTVPSKASDFIVNNQVNTAKLTETYAALPENTKQVWTQALETNITEALRSATPAEVTALQQLLAELGKL